MVPAVRAVLERGQNLDRRHAVQFMRSNVGGDRSEDAVAEGRVIGRGRRTVFLSGEAFGATSGQLLVKSVLTSSVSPPR